MKPETIEKKNLKLKHEVDIDIFSFPDEDFPRVEEKMTEALRLLQEEADRRNNRFKKILAGGIVLVLAVSLFLYIFGPFILLYKTK